MKNDIENKLNWKQKIIARAIEPTIDKVLRASYQFYCDKFKVPFTEIGYEYYMNDIKYILEKGDDIIG